MISGIVLLEIELDTSEKIATKILFLVLRNSYETDQKRGLHHNSSIRLQWHAIDTREPVVGAR